MFKNQLNIKSLDFDKIFKLQIFGMKFTKCHPDIILNKFLVLKIMFAFSPFTIYFFLLINCVKYYITTEDYFNALKNCVPVTFYICMMCNYFFLVKHRSTLGSLIKSINEDYKIARNFDRRRKNILLLYAQKGVIIMKIWFVLMISVVLVFVFKSTILTIYKTYKLGKLVLIPFHVMHYPFDIDIKRVDNIYLFVATFIGETVYTLTSSVIYFLAVPPGSICILHACGQLELIKLKFERIFEKENVDNKLKEIVKNLQYVYRFVDEINTCFTFMYEILLKQAMLMLPLSSFAIIQSMANGNLTIEYASILLGSLLTSSIPCYYGDLLIEKGEEVRQMAYSCGWERVHEPAARKTLLIILTRALKPVAIKSIFNTICLDTLTNVYRQSYTIFNLMSAMWN